MHHDSDIRIAHQSKLNLVPADITWGQWCDFSTFFSFIWDSEAATRYQYGKHNLID